MLAGILLPRESRLPADYRPGASCARFVHMVYGSWPILGCDGYSANGTFRIILLVVTKIGTRPLLFFPFFFVGVDGNGAIVNVAIERASAENRSRFPPDRGSSRERLGAFSRRLSLFYLVFNIPAWFTVYLVVSSV